MSGPLAQLNELFNSFQGEGLYVGQRQTFIRFAGCNLACQYCDSPQALSLTPQFKIETTPGSKESKSWPNPVPVDQLVELVAAFEKPKGVNHSVSLTGGEPLLQVDFLKVFLPALKARVGLPVYLETNGVLPDHLAEVVEQVDIIALDLKLPSATGLSPYWKEHRKALEIAFQQELFVKVVVSRETKVTELSEAIALIAGVDEGIPLVIQPVTPHGPVKHRPRPDQLIAFQTMARRRLQEVRVIPQTQRIIGML